MKNYSKLVTLVYEAHLNYATFIFCGYFILKKYAYKLSFKPLILFFVVTEVRPFFIGIATLETVSERVGNSSLTGLKLGYSFRLHKSAWLKGKKRVDSVWIFSSKAPVFPLFFDFRCT